jgi:hypothetical protein
MEERIMNNILHQTVIDDKYQVIIGEWEADKYCSVRLLPQECFLFRAGLEHLVYCGQLEDGDATHDVNKDAIDKILAWASDNGYQLEY